MSIQPFSGLSREVGIRAVFTHSAPDHDDPDVRRRAACRRNGVGTGGGGRDRRAATLLIATVLLAVSAYRTGPDFLDTVYYVTAVGGAVVLGFMAVLRPVQAIEYPIPASEPTVTLRDGVRHHIIAHSQIIFLKADDDYCTVYLSHGREVIVTMTLKTALALLPAGFVRIHRSHAINVRHLSGTRAGPNGRMAELTGGATLPVGRTYAAELRALIEKLS